MSYDDNIYYSPEKHGLVKIAECDLAEADYSFDILAAWKGPEGIYLATDSGCSCPSPFEDYTTVADLTGPLTVSQAIEEATSLKATAYNPEYGVDEFKALLGAIASA